MATWETLHHVRESRIQESFASEIQGIQLKESGTQPMDILIISTLIPHSQFFSIFQNGSWVKFPTLGVLWM